MKRIYNYLITASVLLFVALMFTTCLKEKDNDLTITLEGKNWVDEGDCGDQSLDGRWVGHWLIPHVDCYSNPTAAMPMNEDYLEFNEAAKTYSGIYLNDCVDASMFITGEDEDANPIYTVNPAEVYEICAVEVSDQKYAAQGNELTFRYGRANCDLEFDYTVCNDVLTITLDVADPENPEKTVTVTIGEFRRDGTPTTSDPENPCGDQTLDGQWEGQWFIYHINCSPTHSVQIYEEIEFNNGMFYGTYLDFCQSNYTLDMGDNNNVVAYGLDGKPDYMICKGTAARDDYSTDGDKLTLKINGMNCEQEWTYEICNDVLTIKYPKQDGTMITVGEFRRKGTNPDPDPQPQVDCTKDFAKALKGEWRGQWLIPNTGNHNDYLSFTTVDPTPTTQGGNVFQGDYLLYCPSDLVQIMQGVQDPVIASWAQDQAGWEFDNCNHLLLYTEYCAQDYYVEFSEGDNQIDLYVEVPGNADRLHVGTFYKNSYN